MSFDIDVVIVAIFLLTTLVVGLRHGGQVKTIQDYALGGRNFSTAALVASIVAIRMSGSGFFIDINNTYTDGLYYLIPVLGMGLALLLTAIIFIPRMGEFLGVISLAEAMGNLYGNNVRIITAIASSIGAVGLIAVQFKAFGNISGYFFDIPNYIAVIIAGVVVTIYSAFGGIRAVTSTDILQFITFGFALPIVGLLLWNQIYGTTPADFSLLLQDPKFDFHQVLDFGNPQFWQMIPLMLYFAIPGIGPIDFQRVAIGRSVDQVKQAFIVSTALVIILILITAWIPFLVFSVNPNLETNQILSFIIDNYSYAGLKGLIIVGVIAMAMSTADSYINITSVLFAHDVCGPLKFGVNKELLLSKAFSFLLGGGAIFLALSEKNLLSIVLETNSFYMPIVTVPVLLTILGFRSSTLSVLIGMGAGLITVIVWKILAIEANDIIFAMLANLIALMGSHYLLRQPGGWVGVKDRAYLNKARKQRRLNLARLLGRLNPKGFDFIALCKKHSPTSEFTYMGLGIYFIIYTLTTMYSTHNLMAKIDKNDFVMVFYQIMMISGTIMAMYPIWPLSVRFEIKETIVKVWWNIAIFYMLVFLNGFFLMVSGFYHLQFAVFTINTILTIVLAGWRLASVMIVAGFYLSIQFYEYYAGIESLDFFVGSLSFVFFYVLLLIGTVLVIFLKPKQEHQEATETRAEQLEGKVGELQQELAKHQHQYVETTATQVATLQKELKKRDGQLHEKEIYLSDKLRLMAIELDRVRDMKNEFLRNIPSEKNNSLVGVLSLSEALHDLYDKMDEKSIKEVIKDIINSGDRLKSYVNSMTDLSKIRSLSYKLDTKPVNLSLLAKRRPTLYKKIFSDEAGKQQFKFDIEPDIMVNCDEYYITQAIDNLIRNAVSYGKGLPINISLHKIKDGMVKFTISDSGIGIPKDELVEIFNVFTTSSRTKSAAGGRGIGLSLCEKVVQLHKGEIKAESDGASGSSFYFTLPI